MDDATSAMTTTEAERQLAGDLQRLAAAERDLAAASEVHDRAGRETGGNDPDELPELIATIWAGAMAATRPRLEEAERAAEAAAGAAERNARAVLAGFAGVRSSDALRQRADGVLAKAGALRAKATKRRRAETPTYTSDGRQKVAFPAR